MNSRQIFIQLQSIFLLFLVLLMNSTYAQPKPTLQQLAWQDMEFYLFMHFGPNTFTDLEWGKGTEKEEVFDPAKLDCRQWCRIAKAAGAKGIIITAKHHDGFCLWPSKFSTHTVRESKWKNGKGDVLKELSIACREQGLKFGVYLSPWDRNHPQYGTAGYNDVFVNMLKEIFTNYGPIWELWWDGANGEGPNGKKQVYDFRRYENLVRKLSPSTVIFSDIGPDIRWCGNEEGIAGTTNWNTLDTAGFYRGAGGPPQDSLNRGNINGHLWIPAECDVSIRPEWFYHKSEDDKVKTPETLFDLYMKSVGRGANLLLNVPPDGNGLITSFDSAALIGFRKLREQSFTNNLFKYAHGYYLRRGILKATTTLTDGNEQTIQAMEGIDNYSAGVELKADRKMNTVVLRENLAKGQHCSAFTLQLFNKKQELVKEINGTTIGRKRIISFPADLINTIELTVTGQKGETQISEIAGYLLDEKLIKK